MRRFKALAASAVLGIAASGVAVLGTGVTTAGAASSHSTVKASVHATKSVSVTPVRRTTLRTTTTAGGALDTTDETLNQAPEPGGNATPTVSAQLVNRSATATPVTTGSPAAAFQGINHWTQSVGTRYAVSCTPYVGAGSGDTCIASNFSTEPPDQMLCAGTNGTGSAVLEGVNSAIEATDTSGNIIAGPMTFNDFFGLAPEEIFVLNSSGVLVKRFANPHSMTDPRCVFDPGTGTYFVESEDLLLQGGDIALGGANYTGHTATWVAVSQPNDPLHWSFFSFDTSDMTNPDCPCLGDQPLMGFNQDGLFITENEYPFVPGGIGRGLFYNGAQMYILDMNEIGAVQAGTKNSITPAKIDMGDSSQVPYPIYNQEGDPNRPCPENISGLGQVCLFYSVQPMTTAPGVASPTGDMYFMSGGDFWGWQFGSHKVSGDNQVFTFDLSGTAAYNNSCANTCDSSALGLSYDMTQVKAYNLPPLEACTTGADANGINNCAHQAPAPAAYLPLAKNCPAVLGTKGNCQEAGIATNDQRMEQVVMDPSGHLWGALGTTFDMTLPAAQQTAGVEWVELTPLNSTASRSSALVHDGITGSRDFDVMFPSVSFGNTGNGAIMGLDISGTTIFPAVGYQDLGIGTSTGPIVISHESPRPEDGFAAYDPGYLRPRWGDYTSTVVGPDGTTFIAGETTSLQRTTLANWSTEILGIAAGG
jgi:hypothetical protein